MKRAVTISVVVIAQALLVAAAVAPQLSARVRGDEYLVRVAPLDPIEPGRGAYVALSYPDLYTTTDAPVLEDGNRGDTVYLPLTLNAEGLLQGGIPTRTQPEGLFLRCTDMEWQLRCGIESYFLPQDEAAAWDNAVANDEVVATVKIDNQGNAVLVDIHKAE